MKPVELTPVVDYLDQIGILDIKTLSEVGPEFDIDLSTRAISKLPKYFHDIEIDSEFIISTRYETPLGTALRSLKELGVKDYQDQISAIKRVLAATHDPDDYDLNEYAGMAAKHLLDKIDGWPELSSDELTVDLDAVEWIKDAHGGVATFSELRDQFGRSTEVRLVKHSPLLEGVGTNIVGICGSPIDVALVERKRNSDRGPWAKWVRLDRKRFLIWAQFLNQEIQGRLTKECLDLIGKHDWNLFLPSGKSLGQLACEDERFVAQNAASLGIDITVDPKEVVFEFDQSVQSVKIFAVDSLENESADPRTTDQCLLRAGSWDYMTILDEAIFEGGVISIPSCIHGLPKIDVGSSCLLNYKNEQIQVAREPHTFQILGMREILKDHVRGEFCILHFEKGTLDLAFGPPATCEEEALLSEFGLFEGIDDPHALIASRIGLGSRDRQSIIKRLQDRGRSDLVDLLRICDLQPRVTTEKKITIENFECAGGSLIFRYHNHELFATPEVGSGPLGLAWVQKPKSTYDADWQRYVFLILRVWLSFENGGQLVLTKFESGWKDSTGLIEPSLLELLETQIGANGSLVESVLLSTKPMVPLTSLGFIRAFDELNQRIKRLEINEAEWIGIDGDGLRYGPSPIEALSMVGN